MRPTKLILVEGIPGSGKSTIAQFLSRQLTERVIPARWWYEEEKGHPLYIFDDHESMQAILADLRAGRYQQVIDAALEKWRRLTHQPRSVDEILIFDSCLFGYLTWTLYYYDLPRELIINYVMEVERIIQPLDPSLIYLYQLDPTRTLQQTCETRGDDWARTFVRNATDSPVAKRNGLHDFAGLVSYWSSYRTFTDHLFEGWSRAKLRIENSAGNWRDDENQIEEFLGMTPAGSRAAIDLDLQPFVGTYRYRVGDEQKTCAIVLENGGLVALGVPHLWQRNRLLPIAANRFSAASFPIDLTFEIDPLGAVLGVTVRGHDMLNGGVNQRLIRVNDQSSTGS